MQQPKHAGGEKDAAHIQEVAGRDQPTLLLATGPLLQEGVQRNNEQPARETQKDKSCHHLDIRVGGGEKKDSCRPHPNRPKRN